MLTDKIVNSKVKIYMRKDFTRYIVTFIIAFFVVVTPLLTILSVSILIIPSSEKLYHYVVVLTNVLAMQVIFVYCYLEHYDFSVTLNV